MIPAARAPVRGLLLVVVGLGALSLTGDDPSAPTSTPDPSGPSTPKTRFGPTPDGCSGVEVRTEDDPHRVLRLHPPGTTYCFAPGTHRLDEPLVPQRGDSLVGRPGAVLNGSAVLTGWTRARGGWATDGELPTAPTMHGACLPRMPACALTHDVFVDGRRLWHVRDPERLAPGAVHADYRTNTVTIGSAPRGRLVEQSVAPSLVRSTRDRVTVRNLVLEKAANEAQTAAVESRQVTPRRTGRGWRIEHNDVRLNHGVGLGVGDRATVRANLVRGQGQLGIGVWGEHVRIHGNHIARNGVGGYDPEWEAGGLKAWRTEDAVLTGNRVHHNRGPGLWSDGGCTRSTYARNLVTDNWGAGIQHEISYDARIVHNRVLRNGRRHKGWAWEAGVQIQSSGGHEHIEVAHNVVTDNANGIAVIESGDRDAERPAPHGPHVVRNVLVRDNVVTLRAGQATGAFEDAGDHAVFRRGIRFSANTYRVPSGAEAWFGWAGGYVTWTRWLGPGIRQDRGGQLFTTGADGAP